MDRADRTAKRPDRGAKAHPGGGFTLIEMITVLVIIGVLMTVVFSRSGSLNGQLTARISELRSQLRYVQLAAMKSGLSNVGLRCDGTNYWAFYTTNSSTILLPGERSATISLAGKDMTMGAFVLSFDQYGIPYTGATPAKLTANATIAVTAGGASGNLVVTPETGFAP